jgi:hypothetical protein
MRDLTLLRTFGVNLDFRPAGSHFFKGGSDFPEDLKIPPQMRDVLIGCLLKVRSKDRGLMRLVPNRAQLEYANRCTKRNIVLKARQLGITTYIAARYYLGTIMNAGTLTVQVAHSQESAEEIFRIVHRFQENLPEVLRKGVLYTSHANVRRIVFSRLDSEYRIETADENAGRGLTIHNLHCSEVARWSRAGVEGLASLRAAVPKDGMIVLESTPNGAGGLFYEEWQRAEETGYTKHFFPWWYAEEYQVEDEMDLGLLTEEEKQLVAKHGLTAAQIAFRRKKKAELRGLMSQEYAEDPVACFRASGESVFEMEAIEEALQGCGEPLATRENGRLAVWFPAQAAKRYVVGVDPAGGGCEGDYSCAEVIERETGMQCAELHGHFPPAELGKLVVELARDYNGALVAVERNNHGHAVLANIRHEGYLNVYAEGNQEGWLTTAVSRPSMIENLGLVLRTEPGLFHSQLFLGECRTFVRHADGSTGAAPGAHDDSVMAMAVAYAVRRAGPREVVERKMELVSL